MTPTPEEWRALPNFPAYEVSSHGRIRSWIDHMGRALPHLLSPGLNSSGYEHFSARIPGDESTRKTLRVHVVVAEAFLGERPGHPRQIHVCHNDGDKRNNRVDNLRYDTAAANTREAIAHGTHGSLVERARTHCPYGHEYSDTNTYYNTTKTGSRTRACRACKARRDSDRRSRRFDIAS